MLQLTSVLVIVCVGLAHGEGYGKGIEGGYGQGPLGYGDPGWEGHPGAGKPLVNVLKKQEFIYQPVIKKVPFAIEQPVVKIPAYKPKFDITPFLKPAQVEIDDFVPPVQKFRAPPKYITRPVIYKEVIQDVYVKQPIHVTKKQVIHKKEQVEIVKGPAVVAEEKVPVVDVKPNLGIGIGKEIVPPIGPGVDAKY